jgi:hypothetical protein
MRGAGKRLWGWSAVRQGARGGRERRDRARRARAAGAEGCTAAGVLPGSSGPGKCLPGEDVFGAMAGEPGRVINPLARRRGHGR